MDMSRNLMVFEIPRKYIPKGRNLKKLKMHKVYNTPYLEHSGVTKMVAKLRTLYFWPKLRKEVIEYVAQCLEWQ